MADSYLLQLDLQKIKSSLSATEGKAVSDDEVLEFLTGAGIMRSGENWICEEISMGALGAGEILKLKRLG